MRVPQPRMETPTTDTGLQMLLNSTLVSARLMISRLSQMNSIVVECKYIHRQRIHMMKILPRYLMVDVVVNDVMATSTTPDLSTYMFKDQVNMTF
jgi:hypothetical protein